MRTLQESLFDQDIIKKSDIKLGELYEISPVSHHCMVTNNIREVLGLFDENALNRANFSLHVREDCSFIEYWSDDNPELIPFINMIFNLPMSDINKLSKEPHYVASEHLVKCLEKYFSRRGKNAKKMYITGWKSSDEKFIEITIYNNIMSPTPSSIKLTFKKK